MSHSCHHGFQRTFTMSKQESPIAVSVGRLHHCQSDRPTTKSGIAPLPTAVTLIAWRTEWRNHFPVLRQHSTWWAENRHRAIQVGRILAAKSRVGRKNYCGSGIAYHRDFIVVCLRSGEVSFREFRQHVFLEDFAVQRY